MSEDECGTIFFVSTSNIYPHVAVFNMHIYYTTCTRYEFMRQLNERLHANKRPRKRINMTTTWRALQNSMLCHVFFSFYICGIFSQHQRRREKTCAVCVQENFDGTGARETLSFSVSAPPPLSLPRSLPLSSSLSLPLCLSLTAPLFLSACFFCRLLYLIAL